MTKYVAFLRGINVGGRIISMPDLKTCFESIGLKNVKTYLNSGNVSFESEEDELSLKEIIENTLSSAFNYPAKVQIYNLNKLRQITEDYPIINKSSDYHDYVIFFENGLAEELLKDKYELGLNEKVILGNGVVYWRVKKGLTLKSSFAKLLSKTKYKDFNTNRNLNTLNKIVKN
jgi:uncharacterized protein (DUF1697 family)